MYDKREDSFQMFSLDWLQQSAVAGEPFWPFLRSFHSLRWQDVAILKDVSEFFDCAYNRFGIDNKGSSFSYVYQNPGRAVPFWGKSPSSDLGTVFPLLNPTHASTKGEDVVLEPGWTGGKISNLLSARMSEIEQSGFSPPYENRPRSCFDFEFLPHQLDFSRPHGLPASEKYKTASRRYFVNSFLGYLASSRVFSAIERTETESGLRNLLMSITRRGVPVKRGSVKFPSEPIVVSHVRTNRIDVTESEPAGGYDLKSTKNLIRRMLGVQNLSELSLDVDVDEMFGEDATSEFIGTSLSARSIDSCYGAAKALCDSDTLYLCYRNGADYDVYSSDPTHFYGVFGPYNASCYAESPDSIDVCVVEWEVYANSDDGVTESFDKITEVPPFPPNFYYLGDPCISATFELSYYESDDGGSAYRFQGQTMRCTIASGRETSSSKAREINLGNNRMLFSIGYCSQFVGSDGEYLDVTCKILLPAVVSFHMHCYPSTVSDRYMSQDYFILLPLSLHPFKSRKNVDAGTYQVWETDLTNKEIVDAIVSKTGMTDVWDILRTPMPVTYSPVSVRGMSVKYSGREVSHSQDMTLNIYFSHGCSTYGSYESFLKPVLPIEKLPVPFSPWHYILGDYFTAVVSYEPEMRKVLFGRTADEERRSNE